MPPPDHRRNFIGRWPPLRRSRFSGQKCPPVILVFHDSPASPSSFAPPFPASIAESAATRFDRLPVQSADIRSMLPAVLQVAVSCLCHENQRPRKRGRDRPQVPLLRRARKIAL